MPIYVTEYAAVGRDSRGLPVAAGQEPNIAEQQVAVSGASAQSAAFNARTRVVMIHTDEIVCLAFGADPVAVTTKHRMAANETRFYTLAQTGLKVAVIAGA